MAQLSYGSQVAKKKKHIIITNVCSTSNMTGNSIGSILRVQNEASNFIRLDEFYCKFEFNSIHLFFNHFEACVMYNTYQIFECLLFWLNEIIYNFFFIHFRWIIIEETGLLTIGSNKLDLLLRFRHTSACIDINRKCVSLQLITNIVP